MHGAEMGKVRGKVGGTGRGAKIGRQKQELQQEAGKATPETMLGTFPAWFRCH